VNAVWSLALRPPFFRVRSSARHLISHPSIKSTRTVCIDLNCPATSAHPLYSSTLPVATRIASGHKSNATKAVSTCRRFGPIRSCALVARDIHSRLRTKVSARFLGARSVRPRYRDRVFRTSGRERCKTAPLVARRSTLHPARSTSPSRYVAFGG